jgi:hypothetical protein
MKSLLGKIQDETYIRHVFYEAMKKEMGTEAFTDFYNTYRLCSIRITGDFLDDLSESYMELESLMRPHVKR